MAHVFSAPRELRLDPYAAASTVSVDAEMRPLLLLAATVSAPPLMRSSFCSIENAIDVGESPALDRAASVSPQKPDRRKRPGAAEALRCAPRCASPHESGAEQDPVGLPRRSPKVRIWVRVRGELGLVALLSGGWRSWRLLESG
jgi:hypothetical protein